MKTQATSTLPSKQGRTSWNYNNSNTCWGERMMKQGLIKSFIFYGQDAKYVVYWHNKDGQLDPFSLRIATFKLQLII